MELSAQLHSPDAIPTAKHQSRSGRGGENKRVPAPCRESKRGRPARSPITILTELPQVLPTVL
jgi:hypothetical protein